MIVKSQILLIVLFCTLSLFAKSSVWVATRGDDTLYIGGTVHLLRSNDYPLPKEFTIAFNNSDTVVFETDIGKMNSASTQKKMVQALLLPKDTVLNDLISESTVNLIDSFFSEYKIPKSNYIHFRPSWIAIMITQFGMSKSGMDLQGVDQYYYRECQKSEKPTKGLESIDEQLRFLVNLGHSNPDNLIKKSLQELDSLDETIDSVIYYWKNGDLQKLDTLLLAELKSDYPDVYKELIIDRNRNWISKIDTFTGHYFILVGTAHLIGKHGLLQELKDSGFKVKQL